VPAQQDSIFATRLLRPVHLFLAARRAREGPLCRLQEEWRRGKDGRGRDGGRSAGLWTYGAVWTLLTLHPGHSTGARLGQMTRIGLCQIEMDARDPQGNLARGLAGVAHVAGDSDIVCLPELFTAGYDLDRMPDLAIEIGDPIYKAVAGAARDHRIHLVAGSVPERRDGRVYNTTFVFDPQGDEIARYSKAHVFSLTGEDQVFEGGNAITTFETPWGVIGLTICYDLRFPESYRKLALAGALVIFVPAQWPMVRLLHWRTLLQARAIENQCFVVGVNRAGFEGDYEFAGHSCAVDPLGKVIAEAGEGPESFVVDLDFDVLHRFREKIPCFRDRRPDLY
jgi:omega-amidase